MEKIKIKTMIKTIKKNKSFIAKKNYNIGDKIIDIIGDEIPKITNENQEQYAFTLADNKIYMPTNDSKNINHFCKPNAIVKGNEIIALSEIKIGEEVGYFYGIQHYYKFIGDKCNCKEKIHLHTVITEDISELDSKNIVNNIYGIKKIVLRDGTSLNTNTEVKIYKAKNIKKLTIKKLANLTEDEIEIEIEKIKINQKTGERIIADLGVESKEKVYEKTLNELTAIAVANNTATPELLNIAQIVTKERELGALEKKKLTI